MSTSALPLAPSAAPVVEAEAKTAYLAYMDVIDAIPNQFGSVDKRKKARAQFSYDGKNVLNVIADYAMFARGQKRVEADIARYDGFDRKVSDNLRAGIRFGVQRGDVVKAEKKAVTNAIGKAKGWMGVLTAVPGLPVENSVRGNCERIDLVWDPAVNNGIRPEDVTKKANTGLRLTCVAGHVAEDLQRVNNVVAVLNNGGMPKCGVCKPAREKHLVNIKSGLTEYIAAVGGTKAFDVFTPSLQASILSAPGAPLAGSVDSLGREISTSMGRGTLSLTDLTKASLSRIEAKSFHVVDDDDTMQTIHDAGEVATVRKTTLTDVLKAAGVISLLPKNSELIAEVRREIIERMWADATSIPVGDSAEDAYRALRKKVTATSLSPEATELANQFLAELDEALDMTLPSGYDKIRQAADGTTVVMEPNLMQRRFVADVMRRRTVMNLSGTGAGKTLSAILAAQQCGSTETVVVCPKPITGYWADEVTACFPTNTEVVFDLPTSDWEYEAPADGVNRVWVVNYEKFQSNETDPTEADVKKAEKVVRQRLGSLVPHLGAIVFDEIHLAKQSGTASSSRSKMLLWMRDSAEKHNEDLVVVGMSATPVINNIVEAHSVLRLTLGSTKAPNFSTKPTSRNAMNAHRILAKHSHRYKPVWDVALTRTERVVNISATVGDIVTNLHSMDKANGKNNSPARMERALLKHKLAAIVDEANHDGQSIVYTHYVEGMADAISAALTAAGITHSVYTGQQSEAEQKQALADFKSGAVKVIIGSQPLATGVDGLQHCADKIIVACMPWTSALDEQLVGRLYRRGQRSDVTVVYIITEISARKDKASYCRDKRMFRLVYKRSLAISVIDGIHADGILENPEAAISEYRATLDEMVLAA